MRTRTRGKRSRTWRQEKAQQLREERATRTITQQLDKLDAGGWRAERERLRLVYGRVRTK